MNLSIDRTKQLFVGVTCTYCTSYFTLEGDADCKLIKYSFYASDDQFTVNCPACSHSTAIADLSGFWKHKLAQSYWDNRKQQEEITIIDDLTAAIKPPSHGNSHVLTSNKFDDMLLTMDQYGTPNSFTVPATKVMEWSDELSTKTQRAQDLYYDGWTEDDIRKTLGIATEEELHQLLAVDIEPPLCAEIKEMVAELQSWPKLPAEKIALLGEGAWELGAIQQPTWDLVVGTVDIQQPDNWLPIQPLLDKELSHVNGSTYQTPWDFQKLQFKGN